MGLAAPSDSEKIDRSRRLPSDGGHMSASFSNFRASDGPASPQDTTSWPDQRATAPRTSSAERSVRGIATAILILLGESRA